MRVEMTEAKKVFSLSLPPLHLNAMCVLYQIPHSLKGRLKKVEKFKRGKREEKVQLLLSLGSFITINCMMTLADIQIDLPSSGDHLVCAQVSHTKDSFVSLMKGFLPQCFFKPKSTYFILHFDCCNGLIYEVSVETPHLIGSSLATKWAGN